MTTEEVNALGRDLITADAEDDPDRFRGAAYRLLAGLGEEHAHAERLAARVHSLAGSTP